MMQSTFDKQIDGSCNGCHARLATGTRALRTERKCSSGSSAGPRYAVLIFSTAATICGSASESSVTTPSRLRPISVGGLQVRGSKLKFLHLLDTERQQVGIDDPDRAGGRFELESLVGA